MIATTPVNTWIYDNTFFEDIELSTANTLKGTLAKSGKLTIEAIGTQNQRASKTVIVKERAK